MINIQFKLVINVKFYFKIKLLLKKFLLYILNEIFFYFIFIIKW